MTTDSSGPITATPTVPPPFDHRRYVPVILTRQGERLALRELDRDVRAGMTPLFVIHPIDVNPDTGLPRRSVEDHLGKLAPMLVRDWGLGGAFVDLRHVDVSQPMTDGSEATMWFLRHCRDRGLTLAPSISGVAHTPGQRAAAVAAANAFGTSMLIRLGPNEWPNLGTPLGDGHLMSLLGETGRSASELHLMLDLEDQVSQNPAITATAIRQALRALPNALDWASVIVAGTAMPSGTASVGRDGAADLPRSEWLLWRSLTDPDYRRPSFGDYCVQHPDPLSDFDPRFMDSSAQLRYTINASWYVVRGRGVKIAGNTQIHSLAQQVVAHAQYSGPGFSWGDNWLNECASGSCSPGNQGVWRKVTTNHHLTYVARQVSTPGGP